MMIERKPVKDRHAHCGYCGTAFRGLDFPRQCHGCNETTWRTMPPVANVVVPTTDGGVVVIRRGIEPQIGQLAFPGGFMEFGETWARAAVRELGEETGYPEWENLKLSLHAVLTGGNALLVFGVSEPVAPEAFTSLTPPTAETMEIKVIYDPIELAFPTHTQVLAEILARRSRIGIGV